MTFPSNLRTLSGVPVGSVTRHRSAAATGAASASHATTSSGSIAYIIACHELAIDFGERVDPSNWVKE